MRVFALKDIPSSTRLGALEVTLSLRTRAPVGSKKEWISTTVFSKLDSKCWPSEKAVAAKSRNFVKWALTEGHLTSRKDAPAASAKICRLAYAVEEEAKMAEDNDNANTDGTSSSAHHEKGQGEEEKEERKRNTRTRRGQSMRKILCPG